MAATMDTVRVAERWLPYKGYKDTRIPWIGKVPEHWKTTKLKFVARVKGRVGWHGLNSSEFLYEGPFYLVTGTDFKGRLIDWESCYRITKERFEEDPNIHLREGDTLVTKDGTIGKLAQVTHIPGKASVNSGIFVTRPLAGKEYDSGFMYYLLSSNVFTGFIDFQKTGTTINHLYQETFVNFKYAYPPSIPEQRAIAAFLDRETARIDALIAKKQRLIELLAEKRTALISQAVTKGLNPDAPMKDSGVEWLGEIPAHWQLSKIKYECTLIKDGTHLPPQRVSEGVPLLSVRNIVNGQFRFRDDDSLISEEDYRDLCRSFTPMYGDVLLAIVGATLGKVAIIEEMSPFHIQRSLGVFRTRSSSLDNHFFRYFLESRPFQDLLWRSVGFTAQPGIYLATLASLSIPLPNISEQKRIAEAVRDRTARLDQLMGKIASAIASLQEYRSSLISAAISGRIDVRSFAEAKEVA